MNYYPQYYQPNNYQMNSMAAAPVQAPQAPAAPMQPASTGINWVQGLSAAKSYLVAPGQSVLLMDSEESKFYIKASDPSGMPMPLRIFEYKETTGQQPVQRIQTEDFVTRREFEDLIRRIESREQRDQIVIPNEPPVIRKEVQPHEQSNI